MSAIAINERGEHLPCNIPGEVTDFQLSDYGQRVNVLRPDGAVEAFMFRAGAWVPFKPVKSFPRYNPEDFE